MEIKTKYSLGDKVYKLEGNIKEGLISDISLEINNEVQKVKYTVEFCEATICGLHVYSEENISSVLYKTKEEAAEYWLKEQGLHCGVKSIAR